MALIYGGSTIQLTRADQPNARTGLGLGGPQWRSLLALAVESGWQPAGAVTRIRPTAYNASGPTPLAAGDLVDGGALEGYTAGARILAPDALALAEALEAAGPTGATRGIIFILRDAAAAGAGVDLS